MMSLRHSPWVGLLVAVLAWTAPGEARAEIGVATGSSEVKTVYKLKIIVDDPDPVGSVWIRYHEDDAYRKVLNDGGYANGDGRPSFVHNGFTDLPIVAWARNSPSGYDVVVSYFSQGAWSGPVAVVSSADDELDPFLTVSPTDGTVHLFYWVADASPRVMYTQAPADLSSWTAPLQVSSAGEIACRPAAVVHDGSLRAVYESHGQELGSTPRQIVLATRSGSTFSTEVVSSTDHAGSNWPEVHGVGDVLWVEWIDATDAMAWTSRSGAGGWNPVEIEPFATVEMRDFHVRGTIKGAALD